MTIQTFVPPRAPDPGTEDAPKIKILKAEFGDGYTQASADGLNSIRRQLSLSWSVITPAQAKAMTDFFTQHLGCTPFWWTPSNESTPIKWTCEDWKDKRGDGGFRTITATFTQSFNLLT